MNQPHKNSDAGLWQRGMLLFVVMAIIAGIAVRYAPELLPDARRQWKDTATSLGVK